MSIIMPHRYGMFIHFGPYAMWGWQEQIRMRLGIPREEYARRAMTFAPTASPEEWVRLAKDAGMEYICFTAKHHDGFCMWNTRQTDFNIVRSCGRDILGELADACAKHGLALSLYYSNPDWNHPAAYNERSTHQCPPEEGDTPDNAVYRAFVREQIKELLSDYGPIYTWFWDIPPHICDPSMNALVRSFCPDILINDRGYGTTNDTDTDGDYSTPERSVPEGQRFSHYTEACESVGAQSWGYRENEDYHTPAFLCRSMDRIFSMGGSYLLNVGPDADGRIPAQAADIVARCGAWYKQVKEAFAGDILPIGGFSSREITASRTEDGSTYYFHTSGALDSTGLSLAPLDRMPSSVTLLNTGKEISACVETYPSDHLTGFGENKPPVLRLRDIPTSDDGLPMVFRVRF